MCITHFHNILTVSRLDCINFLNKSTKKNHNIACHSTGLSKMKTAFCHLPCNPGSLRLTSGRYEASLPQRSCCFRCCSTSSLALAESSTVVLPLPKTWRCSASDNIWMPRGLIRFVPLLLVHSHLCTCSPHFDIFYFQAVRERFLCLQDVINAA